MTEASQSQGKKATRLDEDSFTAFNHAAAGHDGVLCHEDGSLIAKPCTQREIDFYESSVRHPEFQRYMPTFMGTLTAAPQDAAKLPAQLIGGSSTAPLSTELSSTDTSATPELSGTPLATSVPQPESQWVPSGGRKLDTGLSIVLENVTGGFSRPCVLDVKLGSRLWADDAVASKRAKLDEVSKQTTSSTLGFRIAGMKVWIGGENGCQSEEERPVTVSDCIPADAKEEIKSKIRIIEAAGYRRYDKYYGRAFNDQNVTQAVESFLVSARTGRIDHSKLIAKRLAAELRAMQAMLEKEESRMYSASILLVYEGDSKVVEQALDEEGKEKTGSSLGNDEEPKLEDDEAMDLVSMTTLDPQAAQTWASQGTVNVEISAEDIAGLGDLADDDSEEATNKVHDARLIDFAHAQWTPGEGPDENALQGIRSLARILEELAEI
ncbi:predicted protein [Uncinocarpus reesii 1704]|uniref:Kinase n=1 Tax=Uncinocarpus reesii (strain UAMH 1704) TaxID=336963 RepID=C4JRV9_UNCRE|nr:uncharacterized protein UREG_05198 [Uncinocarpus reesii 1704]EEP80356.1 predicted protein [Uncinocarpus reesii 1704]